MLSSIEAGAEMAENSDAYIAIAILVMVGTTMFVNPKNSAAQKIVYWIVAPLAIIILLSFAFTNLFAGIASGVIGIAFLGLSYLRYTA